VYTTSVRAPEGLGCHSSTAPAHATPAKLSFWELLFPRRQNSFSLALPCFGPTRESYRPRHASSLSRPTIPGPRSTRLPIR
jgi:hypothetical protein